MRYGIVAREDGEEWRPLSAPLPAAYADNEADAWFAVSKDEADATAARLTLRDDTAEYCALAFGAEVDYRFIGNIAMSVPEGNC